MDALRSILPKVLRKRGLHGHAVASLATFAATQWIRNELPRHAASVTVTELADAVLVVECANGIAQQECRYLLPALTTHLSRACPDAVVREIRVIRSNTRKR